MISIALVHEFYQQPGGEDAVVAAERSLLMAGGHRVIDYRRHNDEIKTYGWWRKGTLPLRTLWAWDSYREVKALLAREKVQIAHIHNTFPLISPAVYSACQDAGVGVVQTLHNYRLFCPAATFYRAGNLCEECVEHGLARSVAHACYHCSRATTGTIALMLATHRALRTWSSKVDCFIALTEFGRRRFIELGLPAEKVVVKPNFVHPDPSILGSPESRTPNREPQDYVLFVGRLAPEKGLRTLLAAWECLEGRIPLEIVGDGPLRAELEEDAQRRQLRGVRFHGQRTKDQVISMLKRARFLVFPSEWYECFPVTIAEAYACSVPVVASRLGSMQEIVEDGRTGRHFAVGDAKDLAEKVEWAWTHRQEMEKMGRAARAEFECKYTAEADYPQLLAIYERVAARAG